MILIENCKVYGWDSAIRGMRNPMNSWNKSDTKFNNDGSLDGGIGQNDYKLMSRLADAGQVHGKYLRMITVIMDVTAPLYWWKEADTYKIGTVSNSCSTMFKLTHKPFTVSDFSFEKLIGNEEKIYYDVEGEGEEIWKDIEEHPGYKISNFGNILNVKKMKKLKPCVNSSGYKKIVLHGTNVYIHRLVAETFIPNPCSLPEVNHKDGNKWNNTVENLEWVNKSENALHAFQKGLRTIDGYTRYRVAKTSHKFSSIDIKNIHDLFEEGFTKTQIAHLYNCSDSVICNILNKKTYIEIDMTPYDVARITVDYLNQMRDLYIETKNKSYWWQIIQLLPSSYNQKRTWQLNYAVLKNIYAYRHDHKLDEWVTFCEWIKKLPYSEFITGEY